ncbi:hypothetical protein BKA66DRAFT_565058 [Pyrenochaeta sp. MPI-SDFR-AT-0127]|nr:hypothetical protein BKA66DRAFT_565058 [Pyrenochaeta sp. MPI-SDFR-AT-0127]
MTSLIDRIKANCKIIWGADMDFDIEIETDDHYYFQTFVREDRGLEFGPILTMSPLYHGSETAWRELDIMLSGSAENVKRKKQKAAAAAATAKKVQTEDKRVDEVGNNLQVNLEVFSNKL